MATNHQKESLIAAGGSQRIRHSSAGCRLRLSKTAAIAATLIAIVALCINGGFAQNPSTHPTTAPSVNLLSMGDWGTGGKAQKMVADAMAGYVKQSPDAYSGMLLVGDNFYMKLNGANDPIWQNVFEKMYDPVALNFPFYACLGNHDYQENKDLYELQYAKLNPNSRWKLPARWYRLDFPKDNPLVTVLMLDSDKDLMAKTAWAEQKQWLEQELAKPRVGKWLMCCAHHPLFSNGGHGDNGVLQQEWGPLFVKAKVDFYVCGHDHDLQHLQMPDWWTTFVLVGGGGADTKLMRHDDRGPMSLLTNGFGSFTFTPESATVKYIDVQGKTLHQFRRDIDSKITVEIEGGHDKVLINPLRALEGFGPRYTPPKQEK